MSFAESVAVLVWKDKWEGKILRQGDHQASSIGPWPLTFRLSLDSISLARIMIG